MCSPTLTDWERPVKYECSQESRLEGRFVEFNLWRDEWLTESKALLISRKTPQREEDASREDRIW